MDSQLKIDPSSSGKSTSKVINNIHGMPWLKQDLTPQNSNTQQCVGKDGQILSAKKTDEDYFAGTREEKKGKKKKEKKVKSMVIGNLGDLVNLTQKSEQNMMTQAKDPNEISEYYSSDTQEETNPTSKVYQTLANSTVWSTTTSTADKLFPNVQSVRIDRLEEEEMFSRAIAESIATIQLEQFNKPSPVKENRWEALYGDTDDEGSWNNIRRNLPPTPESTESSGEPSGQRKSCNDNSNSSKTGGILRNRHDNPDRYVIKPEELDFGFKSCSESSKDEVKTSQSLKSVSFNESIDVKVRSSESSENEECEKTPILNKKELVIDKYGRVDGCSERRLFMGKGARLKELEFLQNKGCMGVGEPQSKKFESNSKARAVIKHPKRAVTNSQSYKNVESRKPGQETKTEKEMVVENLHEVPETKCQELKSNTQAKEITETQKPAITTTFTCPETSQSQKSSNLQAKETTEAQEPAIATSTCLDTLQSQKPSDSEAKETTEAQEPAIAISTSLEILQSQKPSDSEAKETTEAQEPAIATSTCLETSQSEQPSASQTKKTTEAQEPAIAISTSLEILQSQKPSDSEAKETTEAQEPAVAISTCLETLQSQKPPNSEAKETTEAQEPAIATSTCLETSQSEQPSASQTKKTTEAQEPAIAISTSLEILQSQKPSDSEAKETTEAQEPAIATSTCLETSQSEQPSASQTKKTTEAQEPAIAISTSLEILQSQKPSDSEAKETTEAQEPAVAISTCLETLQSQKPPNSEAKETTEAQDPAIAISTSLEILQSQKPSNSEAEETTEAQEPAIATSTCLETSQSEQPSASQTKKTTEAQEPAIAISTSLEILQSHKPSDSEAKETTEAQEPAVAISTCLETLQSQKPPNSEAKETTEAQDPAIAISTSLEILQSQKPSNSEAEETTEAQEPAIATSTCLETSQSEQPSASQTKETTEAQEPAVATSTCLETLQSQKPSKSEVTKTTEAQRAIATSTCLDTLQSQKPSTSPTKETTGAQKPVTTTSKFLETVQSRKLISNPQQPEKERATNLKNDHRPSGTRQQKHKSNSQGTRITNTQEPVKTTSQRAKNVQSQKAFSDVSFVESKLAKSEKKEGEMKYRTQITKGIENVKMPRDVVSNTSGGTRMEEKQTNHRKNQLVSLNTKTITSDNEKPADKIINPLERKKTTEKKDITDLEGNIVTDATMPKDLAEVLKIIDNASEGKELESKSSRCLVPTLVGRDKYMLNFSPINIEDIDSHEVTVNADSRSPACQNLLLAGVSCSDSSCDVHSLLMQDTESQNSQYQNDPIPDLSIPPTTASLQSQTLNNMQHIQPTCIRNVEQIHQNTPINQLQDLNSNAYAMPYNFTNVANKSQIDQRDYAYLAHSLGLLNPPCHYNVPSFVDNRENFLPDQGIDDSGGIADYSKLLSHESASDERRSLLGRPPPGLQFVRYVQLPPGFTKKLCTQEGNVNEDDRVIDSPAVTDCDSVMKAESKKTSAGDERPEPRSRNTCRVATRGNFTRGRAAHHGRYIYSPAKKRRNYYKSQTHFKPQESNYTENRRGPYPILGATRNSRENFNSSNNDELKSSLSPKSQREEIVEINQSPSGSRSVIATVNDNTSENSTGQSSTNNNYLASNMMGANPDLNRRVTNNPNVAFPVMCQIPGQQFLGSNSMANWQYNMNSMDQTHMPTNLVPNYQMPVTNVQNSELNPLADCFEASGHQNLGYQQLPLHMLSRAQVPASGIPHEFDEEGNNSQNVRPGNTESFEMYPVFNYDHPVGMQRSCPDYNLNDSPLGQFISNFNFHATGTFPIVQASREVRNNQSNDTTNQILDNLKAGRGRGRFLKKNLP